MAPYSSTLAWKIQWMEEPGRLQSMGSLRVRHDWVASLSLFTFMHWRRKWQSTPVFLPGESQGRGGPGGLPSLGSHRVGHNWSDLAAAAAGVKKWNLGVDTWEFYHQSKVSSLSSPSSLFTWVLSLRLSAPKANSRCFHIWPSCQAAQRGWQEASSTFFQPGFLRKSLFQYFISVQFFLPSFQCLLLILRTLTFDVQISVIVSWLNWYIVTFWSLCNPFCF